MSGTVKDLEALVETVGDLEEMFACIRFQFPGLVADLARARDFLFSDSPDSEKVKCIVAACAVKEWLLRNRSHLAAVPTMKPYAAYKKLYPAGKLSSRRFNQVFSVVNQVELNPKEIDLSNDSVKAVAELKKLGEPMERVYEVVRMIATDPRSALRMVGGLSPKEIADRQKIFMETIRLIGKKPSNRVDSVCAAYLEEGKDILLENLFAYFAFTSSINVADPDERVLIVGASPLYIRRWLRDENLASVNATFTFENIDVRDVFQATSASSRTRFISFKELQENPLMYMADRIMVFGNHTSDGYQPLIKELKRTVSTVHTLFYLGADSYVTSTSSLIYQAMREDDMKLTELTLLPAGIHDASDPQRKMFLRAEFGYVNKSAGDAIDIKFYSLDRSGEFQCLTPKTFVGTQLLSEFIEKPQQIRNFYRVCEMDDLRRTDDKRNPPEVYPFSLEIELYATASLSSKRAGSELRVEAYAKNPTSDNGKGDRIAESIKRSKKVSRTDLPRWMVEEYPYKKIIRSGVSFDVREIIGAKYREAYRAKPVTFKTLVYLYPEIEDGISKIGKKRLYELAGSDLGDCLVTNITSSTANTVLNQMYPTADDEIAWLQARRALADALDVAIKNNHCTQNEIKEEIKRDYADHAALQIVRNNLRKSNFLIPELQKIYQFILTKLKEGHFEFLGALICLMCGLESNIVCAMKWRDFVPVETFKINGEPMYQFYIRRQLRNDGTAFKPFEKPYSFRVVPCPPILAYVLLEEYKRQRDLKKDLTDELFASEAILQGAVMTYAGTTRVVPPRELSRLCRDMIRSIGIPDQIISIPDDEKGTTESNLVNYTVDFFRSNFRHYANIVSKCNPGELAYLLGDKWPTTYDRNYCDYANDRAQLILFIKLSRWISLLDPKAKETSRYISKNRVDEFTFVSQEETSSCVGIDAMITVPKDTLLSVWVESEYGFNGYFEEVKEVSEDGSPESGV